MPGATKTKLMYGAYLSYAQLKEYLSFMQQKDLLTNDDGQQIYRLTQRGLQFLNVYEELKEIMEFEVNSNKESVGVATARGNERPMQVIH